MTTPNDSCIIIYKNNCRTIEPTLERRTTIMKKIRLTYNAPVTLTFVMLCFMATLLNYITQGASNVLLFMTYHSSLTNPLTYLRFFTHVLGHSGWAHFIGNASYLLLLGPMLEEKHGGENILKIILVTALVTGLINYIFFPRVALCGASGVAFAFILLTSFTSFREGEIPISFVLVALIYLGQQVYDGLVYDDNISNMAHIAGGIVGSITGYKFNKKA